MCRSRDVLADQQQADLQRPQLARQLVEKRVRVLFGDERIGPDDGGAPAPQVRRGTFVARDVLPWRVVADEERERIAAVT